MVWDRQLFSEWSAGMFKNYKPDKLDYAAIVLFVIVIIVALYLRH